MDKKTLLDDEWDKAFCESGGGGGAGRRTGESGGGSANRPQAVCRFKDLKPKRAWIELK